jgi:breast cancer 2 susceptibility protein
LAQALIHFGDPGGGSTPSTGTSGQFIDGFTRASGGPPIPVSQAALANADAKFGDSVSDAHPTPGDSFPPTPFTDGFKRASGGSAIQVSDAARTAAQAKFSADLPTPEPSPSAFPGGFTRARGGPEIPVSGAALARAKAQFADAAPPPSLDRNPPIPQARKVFLDESDLLPPDVFPSSGKQLQPASSPVSLPKPPPFPDNSRSPQKVPFQSPGRKMTPSTLSLARAAGFSPEAPTPPQRLSVPPPKPKVFKPPKASPRAPVAEPKEIKPIQVKRFFDPPQQERLTLSSIGRFYGLPKRSPGHFFSPKDGESFRFPDGRGSADAFVALIDGGLDPLLLKTRWLRNHYKWIVWKLINLDLCYPDQPPLATFDNVLSELKYRAQIEIYEEKRSCVRLLYERDGPAAAFMVLCVCDLLPDGCIELTDGWYSIPATIDLLLADLVKSGDIGIGMKLRICCAQLDGEDASGPLDEGRSTRLILRVNSVRHARWDSSLGYQPTALFPVNLASVYAKGGPLPFIEVVIQKKYPFLYRQSIKVSDTETTSVFRTHAQQLAFERKREQELADGIDRNRETWERELREEGTSVSQSSAMLRHYLAASDQGAFLAGVVGEQRLELVELIERHTRQVEEALRGKASQFAADSTPDITTLFSLFVTDLCPRRHSDAEVSLWRMPLDVYDELREGMAVRIFGLEASESRADKLNSRGQARIEKLEPQPPQLEVLYRPRGVVRFSDFRVFAQEMALPVGTEFDLIGFVVRCDDEHLYLTDGSPTIALIESRTSEAQKVGSLIIISNARFQSFDQHPNIVQFSLLNSSLISRNPAPSQKPNVASLLRLREHFSVDAFSDRLSAMQSGFTRHETPAWPAISFLSNTTMVASLRDFDAVDPLYTSGDVSLIVFGSIFVDASWKKAFIESREEFTEGLNLLLPLTCGRAERFVTVPSHRVDAFFNAVGRAASAEACAAVSRFFDRFFDAGAGPLARQRAQLKSRFMLDTADVELMLRQALWHCEFVYDEAETVERMRNRRGELVFPFLAPEWRAFVSVLRAALVGTDLLFELYDDGRLAAAALSMVSDVGVASAGACCRRLAAHLAD